MFLQQVLDKHIQSLNVSILVRIKNLERGCFLEKDRSQLEVNDCQKAAFISDAFTQD
jgi:hypothetical protein